MMALTARLRSEINACLILSVPLAGAQLSQAMTSFTDTVMMGLLGSQTLAAGGLGAATFGVLLIISTGIVSAVSPLVAEAYGSGQLEKVGRITAQGVWLAVFLALPITLLLWNMGALMSHFGQAESIVVLTQAYLKAIAWGVLPALIFAAFRSTVTALSRPRPVLAITISGTLFNVVANYVLMFGKFGLPTLGLAGIGWASSLSFWLMLVALIIYIKTQPALLACGLFRHLHRFERQRFQELVGIGIPIGVLFAVEAGLFTITTFLMGYLGTTTLAAHQIALQTSALTFMVPMGISLATTIRVGQLVGQGDSDGARLAGYVGIGLGALFMAVMGLIMWIAPRSIIALYLNLNDAENAAVIQIATSLLGVAALFQIVDGIQAIAAGALRGLKDTRIPMLIGIIAYWGVGLTSGYLLGLQQGMGGVGLWLGLAIGLAIAACVLTWRFHSLVSLEKTKKRDTMYRVCPKG
ncbi:MAG: MATE family efflux transporter [Oculatellaceae cyanobacterium bins.114]|nr:MATE family efflux transporter [Oculatellaceae cyanobacterium bins.114]